MVPEQTIREQLVKYGKYAVEEIGRLQAQVNINPKEPTQVHYVGGFVDGYNACLKKLGISEELINPHNPPSNNKEI